MSDQPQKPDREQTSEGSSGPFAAFGKLAHDDNDLPAVAQTVDRSAIRHLVTQIKSAEHQIGEHILTALQDDDTVAVLTAVVAGTDGSQQIVSAALDPDMLSEVQKILHNAEKKRKDETPCVGFHCLLKQKDETT